MTDLRIAGAAAAGAMLASCTAAPLHRLHFALHSVQEVFKALQALQRHNVVL